MACSLPLLIAYQRTPQPAFYNQWLASVLWLIALILLALQLTTERARPNHALRRWVPSTVLIAFFAVLIVAVLASGLIGNTPWFLLLPSLSVLLLCLASAIIAARLSPHVITACVISIAVGLLVAALGNTLVAALQLAAPRWHDEVWIAGLQGDRAYGNLRQPNLLALAAVWGALAATLIFSKFRALSLGFTVLFLLCVLWSGSRAGLVAFAVAAASMGLYRFDSQAHHDISASPRMRGRRFLIAGLALSLLAIAATTAIVLLQDGRSASMSHRFLLWHNTLELIAQSPWLGAGFNQLNFAWTLTPLAQRSPDVFDHAHNFVLQWAAELGVPVALVLCGLLATFVTGCVRAPRVPWRWPVLGMIAAVLVQSLVEYPLWFAHFLLPTTMLAALLGARATQSAVDATSTHTEVLPLRGSHLSIAIVIAFVGGTFAAAILREYDATASIYDAGGNVVRTRATAADASQHFFYGHYGDYATIMLNRDTVPADRFARPTRAIIDEKLLVAWSRSLAREGRMREADFIAARAREFPASAVFSELPKLAPVRTASAPERALTHADFR